METAFAETQAIVGQLSKVDIAAMRKASMASFHWTANYNPERYRWDNDGAIRLTRRLPNAGPLDEQERTYEFAVECRLRDYAKQPERAEDWGRIHCFDMEHCAQQEGAFRTVAEFVRPGDVVSLEWIKDNDNENLRNTERNERLHRDQMNLIVKRGERRHVFHLFCSICPHNTARMIRMG